MKIACDACEAKYSIADEKIRGKVFKIRCKKCSNVIVVRAADEAPVIAAADPDAIWHLVIAGDQVGPLTVDDVGTRVDAREATGETLAWREGLADWAPLGELEAFAARFRGDAPATEPPPDHAKLRGERNESSVLFSLGNLAKIAATTPRPAPSTGGEGSGLIDIRSMASAYLGAGPAPAKAAPQIGSLDDLPVFATSAFAEPAVLVPTPTRPTRSRLLLAMVGSVGVLAAVAIVLVVMLMKTSPAKALAVASAEPPPPVAAPPPVEKLAAPIEKPAPPPVEPAAPPPIAPPPNPRPSPHREAKAHPAQAPVVAPPIASKEAHDCDEVFCTINPETPCCHAHASPNALPSKQALADPSLPEKLVSSMIGPALAPVRAKAMACGATSTARGKVRIHVKVGPEGRVGDVAVEEAPEPALGTCVSAAVRHATFPKTQTGGSFAVPYLF